MNLEDSSIKESEPCIFVEGPKWADAEFYGNWLLMAAKAEALWEEALKNPIFEKQVERLLVIHFPDFGICATVMLSWLVKNYTSFAIQLYGEEVELVEAFPIMVEMGFFVLTGQRYQMVTPAKLNMDSVKLAALKFAQTEDAEYFLHPEYLVATIPYAEAKAWQGRLRDIDQNHRCADRLLLLEDANGAA